MFESTASPAEYAAIDDKRRTFHVLDRPAGAPAVDDYILVREVGYDGALTGKQLYVRVRYVELVSIFPSCVWIVSIELSVGSSRRMPAVKLPEDRDPEPSGGGEAA